MLKLGQFVRVSSKENFDGTKLAENGYQKPVQTTF